MSQGALGAVFVSYVDVAEGGGQGGKKTGDVLEGEDGVVFGHGWKEVGEEKVRESG